MYIQAQTHAHLASFPGPAQLSVACSTDWKGPRTESDGKLGGAWERGYAHPHHVQSSCQ